MSILFPIPIRRNYPALIIALAASLAAARADIVINEIHYNGEPNNVPAEFVELHNTGPATEDVSGWFFNAGIDFVIPATTEIASGEFLVIAENPATLLADFGVNAIGSYTGRLSGDGETIELRRADGTVADTVSYRSEFPWPTASNGEGASMELIDPALDNDIGGSWRASTGAPAQPTPGLLNSTVTANAPPAVRQVDHSPSAPVGDQPVTITAKVTDTDGVNAVTLEIQSVAPGAYVPAYFAKTTSALLSNPNGPRTQNPDYWSAANWEQITMVDDGTNGDAVSGDNVYTAVLAGRPHRHLVRYRITVADTLGASVRVPYADDESLNFAYFSYDGVPDYRAETRSVLGAPHTYSADIITSVPVYHVLTTAANFDQAVAYNSADRIGSNNYDARSAYNWNCTFVYEGKVYDNIGYRLRQRNARYSGSGKRSFKFRFNLGQYPKFRDMDGNPYPTEWKFLASHKMRGSRGNYTWGLEQTANHILWNMTGTPAPFTHWFNMRVIRGAEEAPSGTNGQFLGDHYGLLLALEEYDSRFIDAHGLEKGNIYKLISNRTEGTDIRRYLAPTGVDDGSDYENIIFNLRPERDDAWLNSHVNYASWNRYHVICDAVRHYDVNPNTAEHLKNRAYYFEPSATNPLGRLNVLPWDSDTSWGPNWSGGEDFCKQAIHGYNGAAPRPEFIKDYNNVVREVRDLIWTEEQISLLLDPLVARIENLVPADRDRWTGGVGGSDSLPAIEGVVADMKKFAFIGGSWTGGNGPREAISKDSGISGQQGRDAYLDALAADSAIPDTPTITYTGDAGFPQGGLSFQSSAFSDPGGAGTFGSMEWRIAEITPIGGGSYEILPFAAEWRYLDNGSDQGTAWREPEFDDSVWAVGNTPAAFGGITAFTPPFGIDLDRGPSTARHLTAYFRTTVDIIDPSLIEKVDFSLLVDDGAVVYVNGVEVFRDGFNEATVVAFDTPSDDTGGEQLGDYDLTTVIDNSPFVAGENIVAIEVHNRASGSSDLGFDMSASVTEVLVAPGQDINFEWQANWASAEIAPFVSDITPPGAAVTVGKPYRARVRHSDNTGRWSHWSAPVEFTVSEPSIQPWLDGLVVSEVMYHPAPPTSAELAVDPTLESGDFEWIEIENVGPSALSLDDIRFTKGVDFDFVAGSQTSILAGERFVVVANESAFNLRYGHATTPLFVVGTFDNSLSNGGEQLKLSFGGGTPIRDFEYNDTLPWPEAADGDGPSLTLIAPATLPDHTLPENWRASTMSGGSPGTSDATTFSGDPLADDDGDGVSNLVAYAAGSALTPSIVVVAGINYPALSFEQNLAAEDAIVTVEVSADLETWSDAPTDTIIFSSTPAASGRVTRTWRSTTPITEGIEPQTEFLRLRVELQ